MRILMISGDKNMRTPGSDAYRRFELQKSQVEQLDLFIWPQVHSGWQIYQAARKNKYDVITVQDPFWRGLLGLKIAWLTGTKLNVQVHADLKGQSFVRRVLSQIVLRHADSVRVVSEKLRNQVQMLGIKVPIHVLPVYVDIDRFKNLVRQAHEQKNILWVGRFEVEKDPLFAVDVLEEAHRQRIDAKLTMLGSGNLESALKKRARGLPVDFPGWQDPVSFFQTADIVISTSPAESYGASIIEALAAGVPVVSLDVGIAKEAGAIISPRSDLGDVVVNTLRANVRGELKLPIMGTEDWSKNWVQSLT